MRNITKWFIQGRFYVGAGGSRACLLPDSLVAPDSQLENVGLYGVRIFRCRRTDKMGSVMKGLMGQCPSPEFLG